MPRDNCLQYEPVIYFLRGLVVRLFRPAALLLPAMFFGRGLLPGCPRFRPGKPLCCVAKGVLLPSTRRCRLGG